jgi:hypothetical protein
VDADLQSAAAQVSSLVSLPSSLSSSLTQQATAGTVIYDHLILSYLILSFLILSPCLLHTSCVPLHAHACTYTLAHFLTSAHTHTCMHTHSLTHTHKHTHTVPCITVMGDVVHCLPPSLPPSVSPSLVPLLIPLIL